MGDIKEKFTERMKSPQWRISFTLLLTAVILFFWSQFTSVNGPKEYTISYSQFNEQLNAGNITSVTIKNLQMNGELKNETALRFSGEKEAKQVKYFQTFLPSFQGETILSSLKEKGVIINVEPPEKMSPFMQLIIGILPWVLIIGVWILIMRKAQNIQGGPGDVDERIVHEAKGEDACAAQGGVIHVVLGIVVGDSEA